MSKVSYIKCDICDKEIQKGGYRLINEPLSENSHRSGGAIDVCEDCMYLLSLFTLSEEQLHNSKRVAPINLIARKKVLKFY